MWRIWCVPNNVSKWQMGFNLAFKALRHCDNIAGLIAFTKLRLYMGQTGSNTWSRNIEDDIEGRTSFANF
jgi:hypothetical protein